MLKSMTGFGSKEIEVPSIGKICIELRSINHKFLESVFHLPEGLLSLEDKLKKEIESRIRRGRVNCVVNIRGGQAQGIFINRKLIKNYIHQFKEIRKEFGIKSELNVDVLIRLPGVLSLKENKPEGNHIWVYLKVLLQGALDELVKTRTKEGHALSAVLKTRSNLVKKNLNLIKARFKKATRKKVNSFSTPEEQTAFLKSADIAEEIDRLIFHIKNFQAKILKGGPVGKELDFITQEMQREANTLAAKSFDVIISEKALQMKSQIEKIREQVQNIE
ncbi:MAG: YicC family protein [Candidatus Omnitrophica bacterium]|nr:YicC family protein [Candidatus Omnitrophota bacterium]